MCLPGYFSILLDYCCVLGNLMVPISTTLLLSKYIQMDYSKMYSHDLVAVVTWSLLPPSPPQFEDRCSICPPSVLWPTTLIWQVWVAPKGLGDWFDLPIKPYFMPLTFGHDQQILKTLIFNGSIFSRRFCSYILVVTGCIDITHLFYFNGRNRKYHGLANDNIVLQGIIAITRSTWLAKWETKFI